MIKSGPTKMNRQRNVLLIVIDCLRADFAYGDREAYIPTITELRNNGFSFLNTIASTSTTPACFASLLTGLYPFENGVRSASGYSLADGVVTLPEVLKEHGYSTYAEVTGTLGEEMGLSKEFDEYNYRNVEETIHTGWGNDLINRLKTYYEEPWFILLHIWSLHHPRIVTDECNHEKCARTLYGRALASIDQYLAKLLASIVDDTIVIVTGDHGEQIACSRFEYYWKRMGEIIFRTLKRYGIVKTHFAKGIRRIYVGHGYGIYDVLVKVPLIFYNRDIVPAGESPRQIRQIDIFPTILDLVGVKNSTRITGESVVPIVEGEVSADRDAYMEATGLVIPKKSEWLAGIRVENKYKYIYSPFREDFEEELYDLENDPTEERNIAKGNGDLVGRLRKKIEEMKTEELVGIKLDQKDQEKIVERLRSLGYID